MDWMNTYKVWENFSELQQELKQELRQMTEWQLKDAFYTRLAFGTGGMRGELGPGPNRMNIYTVRKVTKELAKYIEKQGTDAKRKGVVIAYDSRHQSQKFALEAAKTLGMHNIQTYVFEEMRPTPELSFAVRYLYAYAGIMITASHNPAAYNGYKVYGQDGAQLPLAAADEIMSYMSDIENELHIQVQDEQVLLKENLLSYIGENLDHVYVDYVKSLQQQAELPEKEELQAASMIAEAAAYYKSIGSSLYERLMILFERYGYYQEALSFITMKGQEEINEINNILIDLRTNLPLEFGGVSVTKVEDYQSRERIYVLEEKYETIHLPKSNVLKYYLKDGSWVAVRPSGTEPKIKFYFGVTSSMEESKRRMKKLEQHVFDRVNTRTKIKK